MRTPRLWPAPSPANPSATPVMLLFAAGFVVSYAYLVAFALGIRFLMRTSLRRTLLRSLLSSARVSRGIRASDFVNENGSLNERNVDTIADYCRRVAEWDVKWDTTMDNFGVDASGEILVRDLTGSIIGRTFHDVDELKKVKGEDLARRIKYNIRNRAETIKHVLYKDLSEKKDKAAFSGIRKRFIEKHGIAPHRKSTTMFRRLKI